MNRPLRLATCQYPITWLERWQDYVTKTEEWVSLAVQAKSQFLVFPEYGGMELASLLGDDIARDLHLQLHELQRIVPDFLDLWKSLAAKFDVVVVAPSLPVACDGKYFNRAYVFGPKGSVGYQEKLIMTRFEHERWGIDPGRRIEVFESPWGKFAIAICYDSEFPLLVREIAEQGAEFLVVPSCTDAPAGYHRVKIACQARALENQFIVAQSPLVGEADWSPAVDVNVGAAGIFGPPDLGFPETGVLSVGELSRPSWVIADIDLDQVGNVRRDGQVLNNRDWDKQHSARGTGESITIR